MAKTEILYGNPTIPEIKLYGLEVSEKRALIRAIRGGDKVTANFPAGLGIKNGKTFQEYKPRTGKANPLLLFPETPHVLIDRNARTAIQVGRGRKLVSLVALEGQYRTSRTQQAHNPEQGSL